MQDLCREAGLRIRTTTDCRLVSVIFHLPRVFLADPGRLAKPRVMQVPDQCGKPPRNSIPDNSELTTGSLQLGGVSVQVRGYVTLVIGSYMYSGRFSVVAVNHASLRG